MVIALLPDYGYGGLDISLSPYPALNIKMLSG